jgi:hypothetical protein
MKQKATNFSKKITEKLSKPKSKFINQMIYGFLQAQSVLLSEISRGLKENILLKKTIERLSRNLENFDNQEKLIEAYINKIKAHIDENTVFCCDKSDLVKHYNYEL